MDSNDRLIQKKQAWAREKRGLGGREVDDEAPEPDRLPPGQHLVNNWPVLDLGYKPEVPREEWRLTVGGFVAHPLTWTWQEFLAQPPFRSVSDFHCVTTWSTFDNEWEGVSFKHLLSVVKPLSLAKFVLFKSYDDYTTNLPLEACDDDDVLLCHQWNGKPLTKEHGGPVREGEEDARPARYSGRVQGQAMTLTISVAGETLGPFELERGRTPRLTKCL